MHRPPPGEVAFEIQYTLCSACASVAAVAGAGTVRVVDRGYGLRRGMGVRRLNVRKVTDMGAV